MQLNVGDSVGKINKTSAGEWKLYEDKINKITVTKKYGRRYFTRSVFYPLDADDVDNNTKEMEESIGQGYILTKEVFGLNIEVGTINDEGDEDASKKQPLPNNDNPPDENDLLNKKKEKIDI